MVANILYEFQLLVIFVFFIFPTSSADEAMGANIIDKFIRPPHKSAVKDAIRKLLLSGEDMTSFEFPFYTKDGTKLTIRLN